MPDKELLLLQTTNKMRYMTDRTEAIPMTLSLLKGHSYCKLFKCDFAHRCTAVDKISTDMVRRAVPLQ